MNNSTPYTDIIVQAMAACPVKSMTWDYVTIRMSDKLRTSGGVCRYMRGNDSIVIELSSYIFKNLTDEQRKEIITHEMAHAVCFRTNVGSHHDSGWRRVCIAMGGNGNRTHNFACKRNTVKRKVFFHNRKNCLNVVTLAMYKKIMLAKTFNNPVAFPFDYVGEIACDASNMTYKWVDLIQPIHKTTPLLKGNWSLTDH